MEKPRKVDLTLKKGRVRFVIEVKHHIREWRQHRNMTIEELAKAVALSTSLISQLERGRMQYTQPTLEKIALALRCEPWELICCTPGDITTVLAHKIVERSVPEPAPARAKGRMNSDGGHS